MPNAPKSALRPRPPHRPVCRPVSSRARFAALRASVTPQMSTTLQLPVEGRLPALGGATGWLNSDPLTPESLRGRPVLVEFWTFTCINWLRTLPYVRAWFEKYRDDG